MSIHGLPRENVYICQDCGVWIRTVDVDEGVTPMFLACDSKGTPGCRGLMRSAMYRISDGMRLDLMFPSRVAFEFYKPSAAEVAAMPESHRGHYAQGGLAIRERKA